MSILNVIEQKLTELERNQQVMHMEPNEMKGKLKLSDFLQYPTLESDPEFEKVEVVLRELKVPEMHPQAVRMINMLIEATSTLEVLEVFHSAFKMYVEGDLIINMKADEWPEFWEKVTE